MIERIEALNDTVTGLKALLDIAEGRTTTREVDPDTLLEELGVSEPVPA